MIISEKVFLKKRSNNKLKYYKLLGYDTSEDLFEVSIKHLTFGSKVFVDVECDFCFCVVNIKYCEYFRNISNGNKYACCNKCARSKTIETNLQKYGHISANGNKEIQNKSRMTSMCNYGVDSPSKSDMVKEKTIETNLERYGVEYVLQSQIIREKSKDTLIKNYGVDHNFKSQIIREKSKDTLIKNYGVDNPSKSSIIQERKKETILKNITNDENYKENIDIKRKNTTNLNFGVDYPMQSEIIRNKSKVTLFENWGVDHNTKSPLIRENIKKTNLEKYGVEHILQSEIIRENIKKTNLEKYGVEHILQSPLIRENIKKTNLEKYGVEHILQSPLIRENIKKTNLGKYGVEHILQSPLIRENIKKTNLEKYGVGHIRQSEIYREFFKICKNLNYIKYLDDSISLFSCEKGHNFRIHIDNYHSRTKNNIPLCTVCYPIGDQKSIKEKELLEYIKSLYSGEVISSYRDGLEIDIYLPELNIGFEFNGLYWHSSKFKDKNYHLNKTNYFKEKGIRVIHIWEDDYDLKLEITKSQIRNLLKINTNKIFARKCFIKEVSIKESREFLDDNHIQGSVSSTVKIGLYFNNVLVSLMTFNGSEGRKKMELGGYNLNRFCNKCDVNVVGGASKLLSHFIKNYDVKRIVSYADKDWSVGNLYEVLGFDNVSDGKPDYKYIVDGCRVHKGRYKKSKLNTTLTESQEMLKRGIYKIYDCGKLKFVKSI